VADRLGLFRAADGGTVFLDEVAELTPSFQVSLLRFLQEGEVKPLGSDDTVICNVRIVAASNRNLAEMVERREFRRDLYYRLKGFELHVPPLRERREDIPLLVQHFGRRTSEEHNLKPRRFDPAAIEALQRYRWRGNIRELRNTVERLMIMAAGDVVRVEDLPAEIRSGDTASRGSSSEGATVTPSTSAAADDSLALTGNTLREFKDAAERAYLVQKLRETNWNISKTAEIIDTPRSNLYKKLEQYGIKQDVDG
jgi:DNA-binding NtrC family response regulator